MKKLLILLLLCSTVYADDFVRKTTWVTSDLITASKLNADPDETARILGTSSNGLVSDGNIKATAAIVESKITFSASSGHNHDGISSKGLADDTVASVNITDGSIVNADVNAAAAIAASKLDSTIVETDTTQTISGTKTFSGTIDLTGTFNIDGTTVTSSATELNLLAGETGLITDSSSAGGDLTGTYPNPTIDADKIPKVIFTWSGNDNYVANVAGTYVGVDASASIDSVAGEGYLYQAVYGTTYRTVLNFRFKKVAGVDDVTIEARMWSDNPDSATEAILNVDIGTKSNTVKTVTSTTPAWVTAADIDVSDLTDGTIYDGVIQLKTESATTAGYLSAITLIGK